MSSSEEEQPKVNRGPAAGPENRRALIAAAREVYAEAGLNAPFSAVAKRAGVGQGSLYRHFPDRTALAVAVYEENVAELERLMEPDTSTLDDLLNRTVNQAMVSIAFVELINGDRHDPRIAALGARYQEVAARLLAREQQAGRAGLHLTIEDVLLATAMLAGEIARNDPDQRLHVATRVRGLFRLAFAPQP
ncbi:TetR/AcrR family transcriptional regulator [uncultured Microbacterium sp.]|uniref:TetR/AcrR family transcriptional regulator n=1 Tax=uncultured Microbacterium sp. TaxID=191216 RepID=UPI0035CA86EE